jgi:hypothetical protein
VASRIGVSCWLLRERRAGQALSTVTAQVDRKSSFPRRSLCGSLLAHAVQRDRHSGPASATARHNRQKLEGHGLYVMRPGHRLAAEWLMSMVGDMPVDDRCIEDTLLDALLAGFNVSFAFEGQSRVPCGLDVGRPGRDAAG